MSAELPLEQPSQLRNTNPWILHPALDLFLGCGGLVLVLASGEFCPATRPWFQFWIPIISIVAHLFSETHIAATLNRLYGNAEQRNSHPFCAIFLPVLALILFCVGIHNSFVLGIALKIYLLWIVQHFLAQIYGLCMIYFYKTNFVLSNFEKRLFRYSLGAITISVILRHLSRRTELMPTLLGVELPHWELISPEIVSLAEFVSHSLLLKMCLTLLQKSLCERKFVPLPISLLLLTTVVSFEYSELRQTFWFYLPAFFHGSQYLLVSFAQRLKESGVAPAQFFRKGWRGSLLDNLLEYYLALMLISFSLFIAFPFFVSLVWKVDLSISFAGAFAFVGLHHFITDGFVWKLRDPKVRSSVV